MRPHCRRAVPFCRKESPREHKWHGPVVCSVFRHAIIHSSDNCTRESFKFNSQLPFCLGPLFGHHAQHHISCALDHCGHHNNAHTKSGWVTSMAMESQPVQLRRPAKQLAWVPCSQTTVGGHSGHRVDCLPMRRRRRSPKSKQTHSHTLPSPSPDILTHNNVSLRLTNNSSNEELHRRALRSWPTIYGIYSLFIQRFRSLPPNNNKRTNERTNDQAKTPNKSANPS